MATLEERFWPKVDASGDCWEWIAYRDQKGYGRFSVNGKSTPAIWVAWELLVGPIPVGLEPDHLCRNPSCVNVGNHIEWVTRQENGRRGQSLQARNARKTHCPKGHSYTEDNIYRLPGNPARYCKACHRVRTTELQRRRRADPGKVAIDRERNRLRMRGYSKRFAQSGKKACADCGKGISMRATRCNPCAHKARLVLEDLWTGGRDGQYPFPGGPNAP